MPCTEDSNKSGESQQAAAHETITWICPDIDVLRMAVDSKTYYPNSDAELMRLRTALALNGVTAFADTTAAFAALPQDEQQALEKVVVCRRLNEGDGVWLDPLMQVDQRTGLKSLHSPFSNSRPYLRPAVEALCFLASGSLLL